MFILGIGSNLGDRLYHLRKACELLSNHPAIHVKALSPIYVSDAMLPSTDAPAAWHLPFLNAALYCQTHLKALDLLTVVKDIEQQLGREVGYAKWSPRVIDIDLLAGEENIESTDLMLPHPGLFTRPFALWPLMDVAPLWQLERVQTAAAAWGSRFDGQAPFNTRQTAFRIVGSRLAGIINVTPDSFSDGLGEKDIAYEHLYERAKNLVAAGAEILDIGAESTAPKAQPINEHIEWQRLAPLLQRLQQAFSQNPHDFLLKPIISVDTYRVKTAEKALDFGINWINDVTGLRDPDMVNLLQNSPALRAIMMHHVSIPASAQHHIAYHLDPVETVYAWARMQIEKLISAGVQTSQLIFDPGVGFGKVSAQSLALIKGAGQFKSLGLEILYGHSRKRFIDHFTLNPFPERDFETALISTYLNTQKVNYLRVHDVAKTSQALKLQQYFAG